MRTHARGWVGIAALLACSAVYAGPRGIPANHPHIPSISPGVVLTPPESTILGNTVGPLDGVTYGPVAFGGFPGGSTLWVNSTYLIPEPGEYYLLWEVADVGDDIVDSAVATDNIMLGGALLEGFEGGSLPLGWTTEGSVGVSAAVPGLSPTEGSMFAWLDTDAGVAGPMFDPIDGTERSRLTSAVFPVLTPSVLSLDAIFLTNDGSGFHDYGLIALYKTPTPGLPPPEPIILWTADTLTKENDQVPTIPEPSTLALAGLGVAALWRRRRRA